jgi:hypothetical protein
MMRAFSLHATAIYLLLALLAGCGGYNRVSLVEPIWAPELSRQASATFNGTLATIHNMRHTTYRALDDYDVKWYDKTVDLTKIKTVDFVMVPFSEMPGIAHVQLSYGFEGDDYVGVSVEVRRREGEKYDPVKGLQNHFPLHYVFADERDIVLRRAVFDRNDVYIYRANATPEKAQAMFIDTLERANKLTVFPEYYHTILNNCTTNVVRHVNAVASYDKVPFNMKVLFPGYSDKLAYQLGLIATDQPFPAAKQAARVTERAFIYRDDPNFSRLIRK